MKKTFPELTSRIFLEPDSLKDGLHLKLIWRRAEKEQRGVDTWMMTGLLTFTLLHKPVWAVWQFLSKAWDSRRDSYYSTDIPSVPWSEWFPVNRSAGRAYIRRKKKVGQRGSDLCDFVAVKVDSASGGVTVISHNKVCTEKKKTEPPKPEQGHHLTIAKLNTIILFPLSGTVPFGMVQEAFFCVSSVKSEPKGTK